METETKREKLVINKTPTKKDLAKYKNIAMMDVQNSPHGGEHALYKGRVEPSVSGEGVSVTFHSQATLSHQPFESSPVVMTRNSTV